MGRPPNCDDGACGVCFRCHVRTVQISPSATPSRYRATPSTQFSNNSWERGIAVHKPSGLPYLDERLDTIPVHEWQSKRSVYERELNAQTTAAPSPQPTL